MTILEPRRRSGTNYTTSVSKKFPIVIKSIRGQSADMRSRLFLGAPLASRPLESGNADAIALFRERRTKHQLLDQEQLGGFRLKKMRERRRHRREYPTGIGSYVGSQFRMMRMIMIRMMRTNTSTGELYSESQQQLEGQFSELAATWRTETAFMSSLTQICTHPAYQRIVGMGDAALPFIFRELQSEPDHWFWALKAITGCDPVPPPHLGDLNAMASDWLDWGRSNGYVTP